jgi:hypothetical protein
VVKKDGPPLVRVTWRTAWPHRRAGVQAPSYSWNASRILPNASMGGRVPKGQPADLADQRQQLGDAVAAGFGWWKGSGHGGLNPVEAPAGECVVAPGPLVRR